MVDPEFMCRRHLLGEHVELHMLVGSINKRKSIDGFVSKGLVQLDAIEERHEELVVEMRRRGYAHRSPLPVFDVSGLPSASSVDRRVNQTELARRCERCRENLQRKETAA